MGDINITYETLFELLRREKTKEELQKMDDSFFSDVASYIKEKEVHLKELNEKQDLFAEEEKEKAEKQLITIKKILKDLYDRRERKIVEMALDSSRSSSIIVDTSIMLNEEIQFYNLVFGAMKVFRKGVLLNMQNAKNPEIEKPKEVEEEKDEIEEKEEDNLRMIKITQETPMFIGPDLEEYGPFDENESVKLPLDVANILLNKGRAEDR